MQTLVTWLVKNTKVGSGVGDLWLNGFVGLIVGWPLLADSRIGDEQESPSCVH